MSQSAHHLAAVIDKNKKRNKNSRGKKNKQRISSEQLPFPMGEQPTGSSVDPHDASAPHYATATEARVVPYDENLLERARTQWQFGDWESLAKLDRDTLQHHPDRARLALLAAAGHQQQGDTGTARQLIRLAQDWGCSKRLVSQIMVAGVYNTLGRAAALAGHSPRMLQHFQAAIATGGSGGDVRLLSQVRTSQQLAQLGLPEGLKTPQSTCTTVHVSRAVSRGETVQAVAEQLRAQSAQVAEEMKRQSADLVNVRKALEQTVKNEILNATKQIEAFLGIQSYINGGDLLPDMHGWPISPDFALYLIELLEANDYDLVIEFGSGTSTVLIAKTLTKAAARREGKLPARHVAFEHLEEYERKTLSALRKAGLADSVQLQLAPLEPYAAENGTVYPYYSCQDTLAQLALSIHRDGLRVLVMVDGPPAATGKHARYPAVPLVHAHFVGAQLDVLLDDYIRDDERQIAQLWLVDINRWGLTGRLIEKKMEKDACLVYVRNAGQC
ncbi:MAG: methyltransferase FkbM [Candidatus Accumulibacter sp.]|uniref:Methyltransferase FkbM n=1 Tax=Candidatus Accumulibacter affinis TaxID=2954384 RepID=A0A935TIV3_9PROT|nr:methyltransferase FkbM [Candidatus Accumulibacter affinis]